MKARFVLLCFIAASAKEPPRRSLRLGQIRPGGNVMPQDLPAKPAQLKPAQTWMSLPAVNPPAWKPHRKPVPQMQPQAPREVSSGSQSRHKPAASYAKPGKENSFDNKSLILLDPSSFRPMFNPADKIVSGSVGDYYNGKPKFVIRQLEETAVTSTTTYPTTTTTTPTFACFTEPRTTYPTTQTETSTTTTTTPTFACFTEPRTTYPTTQTETPTTTTTRTIACFPWDMKRRLSGDESAKSTTPVTGLDDDVTRPAAAVRSRLGGLLNDLMSRSGLDLVRRRPGLGDRRYNPATRRLEGDDEASLRRKIRAGLLELIEQVKTEESSGARRLAVEDELHARLVQTLRDIIDVEVADV